MQLGFGPESISNDDIRVLTHCDLGDLATWLNRIIILRFLQSSTPLGKFLKTMAGNFYRAQGIRLIASLGQQGTTICGEEGNLMYHWIWKRSIDTVNQSSAVPWVHELEVGSGQGKARRRKRLSSPVVCLRFNGLL